MATNFVISELNFFDRLFKIDNYPQMNFSIEIGPHSDLDTLPPVKDVYVTMLPGGDYKETAQKSGDLVQKGFNPVPHFPARSIANETQLKEYISMCKDVGVKQALVIGGSRDPIGKFDLLQDRKRFSMDWYYPIISGAFNRDESKDIIVNTLANFYIEGLGIKCVKEEPWVTVAETNEFVIAAVKADEINLAKNIFLESLNISDEDNIPYMGWQYVENIFWPDEKPSWTAAAVILAADSLYKFTDGSNLFIDMQTKNL